VAVVDEIAAAAELVMGQAKEARPVVIFRGLDESVVFCEKCCMEEVYISRKKDLFRNML
jgi:F420-0:gamma-glutamyl ligase